MGSLRYLHGLIVYVIYLVKFIFLIEVGETSLHKDNLMLENLGFGNSVGLFLKHKNKKGRSSNGE